MGANCAQCEGLSHFSLRQRERRSDGKGCRELGLVFKAIFGLFGLPMAAIAGVSQTGIVSTAIDIFVMPVLSFVP